MDIANLDRRARAAGYDDGLLELFAAVVLLLLAAGWSVAPGLVGLLAAVVAIYGWRVVERVKVRVTYPRIGYFQERTDEPRSSARGMLLFIGGALLLTALVVWLSGGFTDASAWRRAAPLASGITLAGGFWYAAERSQRPRHRIIAAWSMLSGIGLWLWGTGTSYVSVAWHLTGLAVPLAAIGVWALRRFLASHPVQHGPDDA